jgi:hypothetical protein
MGQRLGKILKLDEPCSSNPKSEISNWTAARESAPVQFEISDFGFELQGLSDFKIPLAGKAGNLGAELV